MGNSALKSHLETSQKTGVFQLTGKGLQEVRHPHPPFILSLCDDPEIICCYNKSLTEIKGELVELVLTYKHFGVETDDHLRFRMCM